VTVTHRFRPFLTFFVASVVVAVSAPAHATIVLGTLVTTVNGENYDDIGAFGLSGASVYAGMTLRVDLEYDTSLAPADGNPDPAAGWFESTGDTWLVTSVTLNGVTLSLPDSQSLGSQNQIRVDDGSGASAAYMSGAQFATLPSVFVPNTVELFADLSFVIPDPLLSVVTSPDALPTGGTITGQLSSGFVNINEVAVDGGGSPSLDLVTRVVWGDSPATLTLSVPSPAGGTLVASVLVALALAGRRRTG
jgi:hypothetical protein